MVHSRKKFKKQHFRKEVSRSEGKFARHLDFEDYTLCFNGMEKVIG